METTNWIERLEVERIFSEEIEAAGGEVQEGCSYQEQLFLRALLPREEEARKVA